MNKKIPYRKLNKKVLLRSYSRSFQVKTPKKVKYGKLHLDGLRRDHPPALAISSASVKAISKIAKPF